MRKDMATSNERRGGIELAIVIFLAAVFIAGIVYLLPGSPEGGPIAILLVGIVTSFLYGWSSVRSPR